MSQNAIFVGGDRDGERILLDVPKGVRILRVPKTIHTDFGSIAFLPHGVKWWEDYEIEKGQYANSPLRLLKLP